MSLVLLALLLVSLVLIAAAALRRPSDVVRAFREPAPRATEGPPGWVI